MEEKLDPLNPSVSLIEYLAELSEELNTNLDMDLPALDKEQMVDQKSNIEEDKSQNLSK